MIEFLRAGMRATPAYVFIGGWTHVVGDDTMWMFEIAGVMFWFLWVIAFLMIGGMATGVIATGGRALIEAALGHEAEPMQLFVGAGMPVGFAVYAIIGTFASTQFASDTATAVTLVPLGIGCCLGAMAASRLRLEAPEPMDVSAFD